jgi:hypothetical protein
VVVPAGGIIVRVDGGEERRGGRGIDVDAAFFMSIFWWREVQLVVTFGCRLSAIRVKPVKKGWSNYLTLILLVGLN